MEKISLKYITILITMVANVYIASLDPLTPAQCVGDFLALNLGHNLIEENGQFFLREYPEFIERNANHRAIFRELINCAGGQWVEAEPQGLKFNVQKLMAESPELEGKVPISPQLHYVLHLIKCVADYAAIFAEDAKLGMEISGEIIVHAYSLPELVEPRTDGFGQLKECIEEMAKPEDGQKYLIGKVPTLIGQRRRKWWVQFLPKLKSSSSNIGQMEGTADENGVEEIVEIYKLKQNPVIYKILQNYLRPTSCVSQKIANEMYCIGNLLATKMMAKTRLEMDFKKNLTARKIVGPFIGPIDPDHFLMQCEGSIARKNALRKHGIEGMLKCCQGDTFVSENMRRDLDLLSVSLSNHLSNKFVSNLGSNGVKIGRLTSRASVFAAQQMGAYYFQLLLDPEKIDLSREITKSESKVMLRSIEELHFSSNLTMKNLLRKRVHQLVAIFDQDQLYLSKVQMVSLFFSHPDLQRPLYNNLACIADYLIIYHGSSPKFVWEGRIVPNEILPYLRGNQQENGAFGELINCVGGVEWTKLHPWGMELDVRGYLATWDVYHFHFQVSQQLEKILQNIRCIADYMLINNPGSRFKIMEQNRIAIDERTIPDKIEIGEENFENIGELLKCMDEMGVGPEGYRILGQQYPLFIRYKEVKKTKSPEDDVNNIKAIINIQLRESEPHMKNRLLKYMYLGQEIGKIVDAKFACLARPLIEQGNVRTSYVVERKVFTELIVYRKMELQILPENWAEIAKNCENLFDGAPEEVQKLEKQIKRVNLLEKSRGMLLINKELQIVLDKQSMCLADFLASHFSPDHVRRISDPDQLQIERLMGSARFKFVATPKRDQFLVKLRRILQETEILGKLTKCIPKMAEMPGNSREEGLFGIFMKYLNMFDPDQLFLSPNFDRMNLLSTISPLSDPSADEIACPICHEDFRENDTVKKLLNCKHYFHHSCIQPWLEKHNECPMCRAVAF